MNIGDKILERLSEASAPISGEQLAAELSVSRNAVWKGVNSLREQGFKIDAANNPKTAACAPLR